MKVGKWDILKDDRLITTPIFDLSRRSSRHASRGTRDFYVLDAPGWVNIIPLTADGRIVFIRQWRHGISDLTLEIPGGMVDPGETPKAAARREMREECGYDSKRIVSLGRVHPNPAIQPNWCYTFLALDARPSSDNPEPEPDEETEVVMVAEKQVDDLIAKGNITHALVIAGFALFDLYKRKQRRPG